jgi:hypothetical protein
MFQHKPGSCIAPHFAGAKHGLARFRGGTQGQKGSSPNEGNGVRFSPFVAKLLVPTPNGGGVALDVGLRRLRRNFTS